MKGDTDMSTEEVMKHYDEYKYNRNSFIAKQCAKSKVMCKMTDPDLTEVLDIMTFIWDVGYRQAINDNFKTTD